ncbi:MAG: hypothetical protein IPK13_05150 [Deltaproteobacteria bacterium]|nr:hypothetical protein [Deltaproteobacteria bacterium]
MKTALIKFTAATMTLWALFVLLNGLMAFEVSTALGVGLWVYGLILGGASVALWRQHRWARLVAGALIGLLFLGALILAIAFEDVRSVAAIYAAIGASQAILLYVASRPAKT